TALTLVRNAVLGLLALVLLSALLAWRATGRLRRRVSGMNATLDHAGKGHLDARLDHADAPDELGELSRHINAMVERAERLLALRKRVTDQVAHEMRSPLTRLDAALMGAQSGVDADPALEMARKELKSSLRLLDGLLDVSSADAQRGDRRGFERVDLGELSATLVELFEPVAEMRGQTLRLSAEAGTAVDAAPSQIGRLVSNLIDNAVKYADENSEIEVRVGRAGRRAVLSVANFGPPILGELREEIFTPFYRHPDMAQTQGHGLGLALCRSIAARHDGTLDVTPNPKRTIFTLSLPLAD
ncbi:MAG: HAMP domain-containing sensor histidine kinase, partial [Litorimonas sp.]